MQYIFLVLKRIELTGHTQYEPYLKIANERMPSIERNKSFT